VKPEVVVLVPPAVVTATATAPADPGGVVTVIDVGVAVFTVAVTLPKVTDVGEERFVPVMVTTVPPAIGPEGGEIDEIFGGAMYLNPKRVVTVVPTPDAVTAIVTAPAADLGGVVTVIEEDVDAVTVAVVPSKVTDVGEARFETAIVTEVPPAVDPKLGVTNETLGTVRALARKTPAPQMRVVQSDPVPVGNGDAVD
jgi:hypothetical protein